MARITGAGASLSLQIARMVESIRKEELRKVPGHARFVLVVLSSTFMVS